MKREDLKQYSGKHVIIILDGKEELYSVTLLANDPSSAYLRVPMLPKPGEPGAKIRDYPLTDADVESLSPSGRGGDSLIGAIYLKRDGDALSWDDASQPASE
jgi:hypothetical protein